MYSHVKKIRYCLIGVFDSYWCLRFILLCSILVLAGSKRSSESPGKDLGICLSVSSASATPASSPSQGGSAAAGGSGSGLGGAGGSGSGGAAIASDIRAAGASDLGAAVASDIGATGASDRGFVAAGTSTASAISVDGDEPVQEGDVHCGKRHKRCTSNVWQYFTKKRVVVEDNGKTYVQMWAHYKWPRCKHKGRCESNYGRTGFCFKG